MKSANTATFGAAGTVLTYSYLITNLGNVTLTSVGVADPLPGLSTVNCHGVTTLAPGASVTCSATYTTTQADVDAGQVVNTATASGVPPTGPAVIATSSATVSAVPVPSIGIVKSADVSSFAAAGTIIHYSYQLTNTGTVSA